MKLKMTKAGVGRNPKRIMVTDADGNFKVFDSAKDAAKYMECNVQSLYNAMHANRKLRGCKIESVK